MLRLSLVLCIGLYAAFVILPDTPVEGAPLAEAEQPVADAPGPSRQGQQVTLETGEVWVIDRVVTPGEEAQTSALDGQVIETSATDPAVESVEQGAAGGPPLGQGTILYVTGDRVNLRSGPSTNDAVVTALPFGSETVLLAEAPNGWRQIQDRGTGQVGYMSGDFLSTSRP